MEKKKIRYDALDNGFLSCAEPEKLQQICDALGHSAAVTGRRSRQAGYEWDLSIWQMEVSLTQIFDRPLRGREFFEEIIRDNLDLGVHAVLNHACPKLPRRLFRDHAVPD